MAAVPVAIVNPRKVRDFAKALGLLERPTRSMRRSWPPSRRGFSRRPRPLPDDLQADLRALVTRRRQLVDMLTAERNRVPLARGAVRKNVVAHIAWLKKRLSKTDRDLRT
jgi:transposase